MPECCENPMPTPPPWCSETHVAPEAVFKSAFFCFTGEICAIGFTTSLIFLINYIKDEDAPFSEGVLYLVAFGVLMFTSTYCKNNFIWSGQVNATKMRKCLVASMYSKICKLSMKSLTQTNSGKLITLVSGEI